MRKIIFTLVILSKLFEGTLNAQNTQIKGFANIDASAIFDTASDRNHLAFGHYDLFITSQITDKVSFLGETVFAYKESEDEFHVGVERAFINYQLKDYFFVSIGKLHIPLGYWNANYHHGLVLQPTISRPNIVQDNLGEGWLPMEDIAVQFNGDGISKFNLGYNLMIGNGVASSVIKDYNESKGVCLNIHSEPIENLKLFISGYKDDIPKGFTTLGGITLLKKTDLQILNGSVAYTEGNIPFEFIGEYYSIKTTMLDSSASASSNGFLLYAGYNFKKIKVVPYVVYDAVLLSKNEMMFVNDDVVSFTVGLRYKTHPLSALKLEYKYIETENSGIQNRIDLQFAIGF